MTDGDALLRAILDCPEDDTPRLVYADWLDENAVEAECHGCTGPSREPYLGVRQRGCLVCKGTGRVAADRDLAEFVRVQVRLARCGPEPRKLFVADGAGKMLEGLPVCLIPEGGGHYSASSQERGLSTETFAPNERVDIYAQVAGKAARPCGWMRGMKYVRHVSGRREVIVFRKDAQSGEWEGAKLQARARELFVQHAASWVPVPVGHTLSVVMLDASGRPVVNTSYSRDYTKASGDLRFYFDRGFVSEWWGPLLDLRRYAPAVFPHPVQAVTLTDRQANGYERNPEETDYRWDVCEWGDLTRYGMLPGYIPRDIWEGNELSCPTLGGTRSLGGTRYARAFATNEIANAALSKACVRYGRQRAKPVTVPPA